MGFLFSIHIRHFSYAQLFHWRKKKKHRVIQSYLLRAAIILWSNWYLSLEETQKEWERARYLLRLVLSQRIMAKGTY